MYKDGLVLHFFSFVFLKFDNGLVQRCMCLSYTGSTWLTEGERFRIKSPLKQPTNEMFSSNKSNDKEQRNSNNTTAKVAVCKMLKSIISTFGSLQWIRIPSVVLGCLCFNSFLLSFFLSFFFFFFFFLSFFFHSFIFSFFFIRSLIKVHLLFCLQLSLIHLPSNVICLCRCFTHLASVQR